MTVIKAIIYGIIQGVTEFLPVSSSGHLCLAQSIFGLENAHDRYFSFDILLHIATLVAVFIVYYKDIFPLVPAFFTMIKKFFSGKFKLSDYNNNERFVLYVIIATIPLVIAVPIKDYVELLYSNAKVVGGILIFNGFVLWFSDMLSKGSKTIENAKPRNALAVGLCQMCAIVPGLSRSGSTITGGLLQGFTREFAVKFSFILSIPAILGANILEIPELISNPIASTELVAYVCGMIAALVSGILAMKLLLYISKKTNFRVFSYYCVAVGIIALIFG